MEQIYHKYTDWEDYKNGMFDSSSSDRDQMISKSVLLLSNPDEFFKVSSLVLNNWTISADVNLSNVHSNRRSWVGQSACSFSHGCNEQLTRSAWSMMAYNDRNNANLVADKIIKEYERRNRKLHKGVGRQMLFEWDS